MIAVSTFQRGQENTPMSRSFTAGDFAPRSRSVQEWKVATSLVLGLQTYEDVLEARLGPPPAGQDRWVHVSSGYRTSGHGDHPRGMAADMTALGANLSTWQLAGLALAIGFPQIGVGQRGTSMSFSIHVGINDNRVARWIYYVQGDDDTRRLTSDESHRLEREAIPWQPWVNRRESEPLVMLAPDSEIPDPLPPAKKASLALPLAFGLAGFTGVELLLA